MTEEGELMTGVILTEVMDVDVQQALDSEDTDQGHHIDEGRLLDLSEVVVEVALDQGHGQEAGQDHQEVGQGKE